MCDELITLHQQLFDLSVGTRFFLAWFSSNGGRARKLGVSVKEGIGLSVGENQYYADKC